jgi:hypothetical protein
MPSSSARTMTYPRKSDKLHFYNELKILRDKLKLGKIADHETTASHNANNVGWFMLSFTASRHNYLHYELVILELLPKGPFTRYD